MPTVNNHDVMECLSWGCNAKEALVASKCDSDGFEANGFVNLRRSQTVIAEEHDYAAPHRFVSGNSYYGFQPFPVSNVGDPSDFLMDTSENRPNTDDLFLSNAPRARKRNVESDMESFHQATKRVRQDKIGDNTDADIKDENKRAEQVHSEMAILESLLKHTHGCDIYNYELSDL